MDGVEKKEPGWDSLWEYGQIITRNIPILMVMIALVAYWLSQNNPELFWKIIGR